MRLAQVIDGVVVNVIEVNVGSVPAWAAAFPAAGDAGPGWLVDPETGEFVPPPPPPVPVPEQVSRFQAKAALDAAGMLAACDAAVAGADALTRLAWAEALHFRRDSPAIAAMSAAVGLSSEQVDELFIAAATIAA